MLILSMTNLISILHLATLTAMKETIGIGFHLQKRH